MIAGKNARALAMDILALEDETFRESFKRSPMKRAKLAGLKRNARAVLAAESGSSSAPPTSDF